MIRTLCSGMRGFFPLYAGDEVTLIYSDQADTATWPTISVFYRGLRNPNLPVRQA